MEGVLQEASAGSVSPGGSEHPGSLHAPIPKRQPV